jgi:hypothetical protein
MWLGHVLLLVCIDPADGYLEIPLCIITNFRQQLITEINADKIDAIKELIRNLYLTNSGHSDAE